MLPDERAYHYVKRNEVTRQPRRHIIIDTESRHVRQRAGRVETWRCGVAHYINAPKGRRVIEARTEYVAPDAMWRDVSDHCPNRSRTVLWAHNLGYDVRIAEALTCLPELGWRLVAHNIAPRGTWLIWRRDEANLTMVDTASIWPVPLPEIGKMFGMAKRPLPGDGDDEAAWLARCHSDVDITAKAVWEYLTWLERADLGNWQLTGAGQSWAAYRHKWMRHQLLVHADADALAAERRAMWTGRCEAYWHGTILRQVVHEWDLSAAYARIARDLALPVRLVGPCGRAQADRTINRPGSYAVLSECVVETPCPVVPTAHDGRIVWPVGRFNSVLWDVEIREAMAAGARVEIGQSWLYATAPALHDWADWVLTSLDAPDDIVPAWQKKIIKHWSRALIGRFGMRYQRWQEWADMPNVAVERRLVDDDIDGTTYEVMHIGRQLWRAGGEQEWSQSMPAITGYVMAACRVWLWRLMQQLPKEAILYVDTDSLLATDRWYREIAALAGTSYGQGLRLKRSWDGFSIYGPRQIVTGTRVRVAGVPNAALRVGRHEYAGVVYESLGEALRVGNPGRVKVMDRVWRPVGVDRRRVGPGVGWTHPVRVGDDAPCDVA